MELYKPAHSKIDTAEDAKLKRNLLQQDFPKSISEFKDHPLYALARHLLKFEAIYPADAAPLGFIRNEAIYSRDCVHEVNKKNNICDRLREKGWGKNKHSMKTGDFLMQITSFFVIKSASKLRFYDII